MMRLAGMPPQTSPLFGDRYQKAGGRRLSAADRQRIEMTADLKGVKVEILGNQDVVIRTKGKKAEVAARQLEKRIPGLKKRGE